MLAILLTTALALSGAPDKEFGPIPSEGVVASVYDGDTFTLETGDKIRLRWVNTPELKPAEDFGVDAREAAKAFVLGKKVKLVVDGEDARDGYGRILAGLTTEQGDLSTHLAERGLAHVFVIPPDSTDLTPIYEAQARAKSAKLGIWSTDRYSGDLHITSFHANAKGDDNDNVNGEYMRVCNVGSTQVNLSAFKLTDADGNEWQLPPIQLPLGHTVKIHSGIGDNQGDPERQIAAYLQSERPVWNNDQDKATLLDASGNVVDFRVHAPKSRNKK